MIADINRMPPAAKALQVYRLVTVEGRSIPAAAAVLAMTPARVVQLRDQVLEWLARATPVDHLTRDERLAAGERIAAEQLHYLYGEAVDAWRGSKTAQVQVACLQQALAIVVELAKFPAHTPLGATCGDDGMPSPVRDCSPRAVSRAPSRMALPPIDDVNGYFSNTLAEQEQRRTAFLAALEADTSPCSPPALGHGCATANEEEPAAETNVFELAAGQRPAARELRRRAR
ncbi:MAG: hypothetical protein WD872_06345 [Pirellulaceae bacterium]